MALINCGECGGQVSDKAAVCIHCGAPIASKTHPKAMIHVRQKKESGCLLRAIQVLAITAVFGLVFSNLKSNSEKDAKPVQKSLPTPSAAVAPKVEAPPAEKACGGGDLACWGEKNFVGANVYCKQPVENAAKFNVKWTDGFLEMKFSRYRWSDKKNHVVTYIGDKAQFQNGFGAYMPVTYECDLLPDGKTVIDVRIHEGRLPG